VTGTKKKNRKGRTQKKVVREVERANVEQEWGVTSWQVWQRKRSGWGEKTQGEESGGPNNQETLAGEKDRSGGDLRKKFAKKSVRLPL